jgi:hypothetical protein
MALLGYDTGSLASFADATVALPDIVALREQISVEGRRDLDVAVSTATIELSDGRVLTAEHDERVLDRDLDRRRAKTVSKFAALAQPFVGAGAVAELQALVFALDELDSVAPILRLVA